MNLLYIAATTVRGIPKALLEMDVDVIASWIITGILLYAVIIFMSSVGAGLFIWWLFRKW